MNAREAVAEVLAAHELRWIRPYESRCSCDEPGKPIVNVQLGYDLHLADALLASDVLGRVRDEALRGVTLADVPTCDYPRCIALAGHEAGHVLAGPQVEVCRECGYALADCEHEGEQPHPASEALRGSGRPSSARVDSGADGVANVAQGGDSA